VYAHICIGNVVVPDHICHYFATTVRRQFG